MRLCISRHDRCAYLRLSCCMLADSPHLPFLAVSACIVATCTPTSSIESVSLVKRHRDTSSIIRSDSVCLSSLPAASSVPSTARPSATLSVSVVPKAHDHRSGVFCFAQLFHSAQSWCLALVMRPVYLTTLKSCTASHGLSVVLRSYPAFRIRLCRVSSLDHPCSTATSGRYVAPWRRLLW